jgi:hypothetical protein
LREAFFLNVASRKSEAHSANGEPAIGGVVVYDLKRDAGRRWRSVMSVLYVSNFVLGGDRLSRTQWEQRKLELFAEFLRIRR